MRLALALAAVVTLAGSGAGLAEDFTPIPRYDVDKGCAIWKTEAEPNGARGCLQLEQESYNYIKSVWLVTPEYVKKSCIELNEKSLSEARTTSLNPKSRTQESFFYILLASCIKPEMQYLIPKPLPDKFHP